MSPDFISIIVPAHNEEQYLSQCLTSLLNQNYPPNRYEIILVNNNSTDRTQEIAKSFGVTVIEQNHGPVGAVRNAGAKQAKGNILAFIDADCVAPRNWLSTGFESISKDEATYGGGYNLRSDPFWIEKAWLLDNKNAPKDLIGGSIIIEKSKFFEVGGFDESITSGEDTKLSASLRDIGIKIIMKPELNVVHLGNPITLKHFFTRQIWHSENYIKDIENSLKDPTFYLVTAFLIGSFATLILLASNNIASSLFPITVTLLLPFFLTAKRLSRSKNPVNNLQNLFAIYFLDLLYLNARSIGLLKGLFK
jgi:glycosyltransferase involved in cell wall biosynthesis